MKKSFIMYTEWAKLFVNLPNDRAGELIKAICNRHLGKDTNLDDQTMIALFEMVASRMDEDADHYDDVCKRRAESIKARWKKKEEQPKVQEDTKVYKSIQIDSDNDNDNENENDNENDNENENDNKNDNDNENDKDIIIKKHKGDKRPVRHKYGRYKHVSLTDDQYHALVESHGESDTVDAIQAVDDYCEEFGKHYSNYKMTIERWGYSSAKEKKPSGDILMDIINGEATVND